MRAVVVTAVAVVFALLTGWLWIPAMFAATYSTGSIGRAAATSTSCQASIAVTGGTTVTAPSLDAHQVGAAHTIWAVAHEVGAGDRGALVGIATAMQESTLDGNPATRRLNGDGDVALFQQRALLGWYAPGVTVEENIRILSDHATAARTFFLGHKVTAEAHAAARAASTSPAGPVGYVIPGLVHVDGWETMPVTVAAQRVQRSAFPDAYAKHEPLAADLVQRFNAELEGGGNRPAAPKAVSNAALCDAPGAVDAASCPDSGLRVEQGLTPDAVRVLRCAVQQWPDLTYGGVREDPIPDHPSGRAIDIMTPGNCDPIGDRIAEWAKANAASLGVEYLIWCQKIWSVERDAEGWRQMGDRGSVTQNHGDHVHVTVYGNRAGVSGKSTGGTVSPVERYVLTARHNQPGSHWSSGFHTGLDFASTPAGSSPPVLAATGGTVTSVTAHAAYGNLVKVDHGSGTETWYAHLSSTAVREGQRVEAGHELGRMGATGNVTGEHLHMEVRQGGSPVDPDAWLASRGVVLEGSRA